MNFKWLEEDWNLATNYSCIILLGETLVGYSLLKTECVAVKTLIEFRAGLIRKF